MSSAVDGDRFEDLLVQLAKQLRIDFGSGETHRRWRYRRRLWQGGTECFGVFLDLIKGPW